jgi:hypothetical protein
LVLHIFRDGIANGRGVYTFPNGGRYEGGFESNFPEGFGEYMLNGETLSGNWARGCLSAGDRTIALR